MNSCWASVHLSYGLTFIQDALLGLSLQMTLIHPSSNFKVHHVLHSSFKISSPLPSVFFFPLEFKTLLKIDEQRDVGSVWDRLKLYFLKI